MTARLGSLAAAMAAVTAAGLFVVVAGGSAADQAIATTSQAKSYYVAPTGSDSNPCTKAAPCKTLGYTYRLASDGDTVMAVPGHYQAQEIDYSSGKSTTGPAVTLKPDGGTVYLDGGLQLGGDSNGCVPAGPNWLTIDGGPGKDFVITGLGACLTDHVTVSNAKIGVGVATRGAITEFHSPQNLLFQNNIVGPGCCGFDGTSGSSPIELRIAISPGDPNPKNVNILDNVFNGSARYCSDWNAYFSKYGPCPAPSCPDSTQCHNDAIHAYGGENLNISRNRFPVYDVQGIFLEEVNGGANVSGTVDDNYFGHDLEGVWHAIWTSLGPGATGAWNIRFNTLTEANAIDVGSDQHGRFGTSTVNVVGNLGGRLGNDTNQCGGSSLKVTYRYNMWEQANAPWIGHCDATDGGPYPVATIASWLTSDGHLVSGTVPPVGFVAGSGLCIATDIDGNNRPAVGCAAGVSEFGSLPPPPPPAVTFGNTTVGTSDDYASSNYKEASWFSAPQAGTVSKVTGYISGLGQTSGSETIRAIVYADNNGAPGALLGFSNSLTVKAGQAYGWVDFAFPTPVAVKTGKVWLGYQANGTTNLIQLKYLPQSNALAYNRDTYAQAGPSNPFGAASPADFSYSIYATFDTSGSDTTPPTAPTGLVLSDGTKQTQVTVTWTASTDNVGVSGYHVGADGVAAPDVTATSATLTGLAWGSHTISVSAFDEAGNVSSAATLTVSSSWK